MLGFDVARRSELGAVVGGERQPESARAAWQFVEHGAVEGQECLRGAAAQTQITAKDLAGAAVDQADQMGPSSRRSGADLGRVRLPDQVRLRRYHAASVFLRATR